MQKLILGLAFLAWLSPMASQAESACGQKPLQDQHEDAATIQALEAAWSVAYLHGDTDLERCLLTPDFTEIMRNGEVKVLADELGFAEKNKGKDLPIPAMPKIAVLMHGNVAVAYGISRSTGADGKTRSTRYADYYVWEAGSWQAFFAQQTQF